jgi:hypothetical protein
VAVAVEVTTMALPDAVAVEFAAPPAPPLPMPPLTSPPAPPVAISVAVTVLFPEAEALEMLVALPPTPLLLLTAELALPPARPVAVPSAVEVWESPVV